MIARDLVGPAVVIDVAASAGTDPDYLMSKQDVLDWEQRHGGIPRGAIVLMSTGWSQKWSDPERFRRPS